MAHTYHPSREARLGSIQQKRIKAFQREYEDRVARTGYAVPPHLAHRVTDDFIAQEYLGMDRELVERYQKLETHISDQAEKFRIFGSNIFDITALATLFTHTDVGEIAVDTIDAPFPAFFIHFGKEAGLFIRDNDSNVVEKVWIEGVYVLGGRDMGGIGLTFVCNNPVFERGAEVQYGFHLVCNSRYARTVLQSSLTVAQAIEAAEGYDGEPNIAEDLELMGRALSVAVNSIMYLSSPSPDIEDAWEVGAPEKLIVRAEKGNLKAQRELKNIGCSWVRFCGRHLAQKWHTENNSAAQVDPHWRRGHWIRQVAGVGRSKRIWQWRWPTIVNRHLGEPVDRERIYDVQPDGRAGVPPRSGNDQKSH